MFRSGSKLKKALASLCSCVSLFGANASGKKIVKKAGSRSGISMGKNFKSLKPTSDKLLNKNKKIINGGQN